ncbi:MULTISPECIES: glycosyltransferase family 2 protein [Lactobacillales]|nr:glycosyltransferase [Carnobacterium sp. PL17RED31]KAF3300296.1 glycosyltransferase [Carnobacterium sp. PL26RED25]KAF3304921.1 glycosyltransferase [Carnobacterium sp. PL24RED07]KAF3305172.1 glycosyltransferase [Carnobacterium sp. PL17GRE32]HCT98197.1 glycosyl transferase [Aerococcus urinaeequi]
MTDDIAVLIPCYNESQTIEKVIADFKTALPEATIYVYDNNSSDNTAELAARAGAVVRFEHQQGKGNVIRSMFRDIDAACYLMIDGDDTYPAEHARDMVAPILAHRAQMVVGDRLSSTYFEENKRPFHNVGNRTVRALINVLFKNNVRDIMTGYRAFSYEFVKSFPVLSQGFEIETEMTIFALDKNLAIENVVIEYRDRPEGSESKLNTVSDGLKVLRTIGRLFKNYKPLLFFSLVSLLLLLFAVILFVPIWIDFNQTGTVERFPTLIVAGFIGLTGIILFIAGLILDVITQNERQRFEIEYTKFNAIKKLEGLSDYED